MHHAASFPVSCACTTLRKASRAVTRLYDEALSDTGLTIVQFAILRNLQREGPLPLMQLAQMLVMERTTLYRALGPLERHGWVTQSEGAGRAKIATLSPQGGKTLTAATGAWESAQQSLLAALGGTDWGRLEDALGRLIATTQALTS